MKDPPSPTLISMLSVDPLEEASPTPDMISTITDNAPTITPLALFSKAVRENLPLGKPYTRTNDIVVKRKPRHFIFPINEGDEIKQGTNNTNREVDTGKIQCQDDDSIKGNNASYAIEVHIRSPSLHSSCTGSESRKAWPFAGLPPGHKGRHPETRGSQLDAWPFASRPPAGHAGVSYRKNSICAALLSPPQVRKNSICATRIPVSAAPTKGFIRMQMINTC